MPQQNVIRMGMPTIPIFRKLTKDYRKLHDVIQETVKIAETVIADSKSRISKYNEMKQETKTTQINQYLHKKSDKSENSADFEIKQNDMSRVVKAQAGQNYEQQAVVLQIQPNSTEESIQQEEEIEYRSMEQKAQTIQVLALDVANLVNEQQDG